jgi:hypothetical protein
MYIMMQQRHPAQFSVCAEVNRWNPYRAAEAHVRDTNPNEFQSLTPQSIFAFAVLQASHDSTIGYSTFGQLEIDAQPWQPSADLLEVHLEARIQYLAHDLNLSMLDTQDWYQRCRVHLQLGAAPRQVLLDLGHKSSVSTAAPTGPPTWWLENLMQRIRVVEAPFHTQIDARSVLLNTWPGTLLNEKQWAFVESPWPGIKPLPIDTAWVEPNLVQSFADDKTNDQLPWRKTQFGAAGQPLTDVLDRLESRLVLVGAPGAGKTTVLRWFARQVLFQNQRQARFLMPIYVPLREYAKAQRRSGLIAFFLDQFQVSKQERRDWTWLIDRWADHAGKSDRAANPFVLLLDGWDEVPIKQRDEVHRAIETANNLMPLVLTSRPTLGLRSFGAEGYYFIDGLDRAGRTLLTQRWCDWQKKPQLAKVIQNHLDTNESLAQLASNPFVLTLMCSLQAKRPQKKLPQTRFELYELTVAGIINSHNRQFPHQGIDTALREALEKFCSWLLTEANGSPRYLFDDAELRDFENMPKGAFEDCIEPSRLTIRLPEKDQVRQFLHASLQEFLAAGYVLRNADQTWTTRLNDPAVAEVLRFAAAQAGPAAETFWLVLAQMAATPDRFGMVAYHLCLLVLEVGVPDGGLALLGTDLRPILWHEALRFASFDMRTATFLEALARLDEHWLAEALQTFVQAEPLRVEPLHNAIQWLQGSQAARVFAKVLDPCAAHQRCVREPED